MKINILVDNQKSWFNQKTDRLIKKIEALGGNYCQLVNSQGNIKKDTDVSFFLSCEEYVSRNTREKSKYNIVVHASDLPKGKGMSPATWQILEGKNRIPVTLFEITDGIDTGDYYLKDYFELNGTELINEWQEKLYECIERIILNFIKNIEIIKPIKQTGQESVYKRRTPEDSELDINKTIKEQFNIFRVVDNEQYPAFFIYKNKKYILKIYE